MEKLLGEWILRIVGAAMICSAVLALTPETTVKKAVRLVCGFVMLFALLSLGGNLNFDHYAGYLAQYRNEAAAFMQEAEEDNNRILRLIIEEECEAYILDKGKTVGIETVEASVLAKWSADGYWYPVKAEIVSDGTEAQNTRLAEYIEGDLGIPKENQTWSAIR